MYEGAITVFPTCKSIYLCYNNAYTQTAITPTQDEYYKRDEFNCIYYNSLHPLFAAKYNNKKSKSIPLSIFMLYFI